ncbi:hypothetical protein, partial [Staphylococcus pasteuri_A]
AQEEQASEISLDDSEMAALDAFESDDLVPSIEEDEPAQEDPDAIISADDLAAALSMEDDQDLFDVNDAEQLDEAAELSFEDALKQQQEMEAELSE